MLGNEEIENVYISIIEILKGLDCIFCGSKQITDRKNRLLDQNLGGLVIKIPFFFLVQSFLESS